jgi:hypothetical protein
MSEKNGFGELLEQSVLSDDILGLLVVGKQLIDQLLVDCHGFFILLSPMAITQSYLHSRPAIRHACAFKPTIYL